MDKVAINVGEQTPGTVAQLFGVDPDTAEFMIAMERGELQGDSIQS